MTANLTQRRASLFWSTAFALVLSLSAASVQAVAPDAGAVIGNQATATYTDGSGVARNTTSNTVTTVVEQIAGVDLQDPQTRPVNAGATVNFPHTVVNTGNGPDAFDLTAVDGGTGTITFTNLVIYPDSDGNGVPDSTTPITQTPVIPRDGSFGIVVAATVPGTVTAVDTETIDVTATSQFTGTVLDLNTDTVTVTANAVISMTKSVSPGAGPSPSSGPVTMTLTYSNTGNATATTFQIIDTLPAGMSYAGPAVWSGLPAVNLTTAADGDEGGIDYSVVGSSVTATIVNVAPGASGTLTFDVTVDGGVAPGNLVNIASYQYDDGSGTTVGPIDTNPGTYIVVGAPGVEATDTGSVNDQDGAANDVVTVSTPVVQGATVPFEDRVINTGNGPDTFEISLASNTFPAGTTFQIFNADPGTGAPTAPLTDTNGDFNPDTGVLGPLASFDFVIVATLPPGASGNNGGAGFQIVVDATSAANPALSDSVTNLLTEITTSTVDLTNDSSIAGGAGAADGLGAGPEGAPVRNVTSGPGVVSFSLFVNNTSGVVDSYDLAASTDSTFATISLPAGWSVVFRNGGGGTITNTGPVPPGGDVAVTAEVTVPAGASAGQVDTYFRALSSTTGSSDIKYDAITVATNRALSLTPDNTGQTFPGGSSVYVHTLANNGNVTETTGNLSTVDSQAGAGWTSVVYWDQPLVGTPGVLDPTDPVVSNLSDLNDGDGGLLPGETETLFVQVFAPAGANINDNNVTTITAEAEDGGGAVVATDSATDSTTVIAGDVQLSKLQGLDANCDGTPEAGFVTTNITTGAIPGACLVYQVTATNSGTATVNTLLINDVTPSFTTMTTCSGGCTAAVTGGTVNTVSAPADGSTGPIIADVGDLASLASAVLTFTVQIDQ
ncbi:MAG: beta strand repeat-containing protein [Gammaproteobacteria bacterium]